ncbi:MAG: cupin domain-containing protein [Ferruginibacter sp.]|nr:cupin domain-containing protein [Cytophagales bacterium]
MNADYWIDLLGLARHPEGGYYREVYRADETVGPEALPARYGSARTSGTSIYFLLRAGEPSRFHRLQSDEIWHYYAGDPVVVHLLDRGEYRQKTLGPDYASGQAFVHVIPRHSWFGATVATAAAATLLVPNGFVLLGCTVAPGFEYQDFELARREDLLAQFPQYAPLIHQLT